MQEKVKLLVSIYLVNGFQLRGYVKGFDNFTVILDCEGKQMLVYKHAITTYYSSKTYYLFTDNENDIGAAKLQFLFFNF